MSEWLHLVTNNDRNGNPRRLFAEVRNGEFVKVVEEGYLGIAAAHRAGMPADYVPARILIGPKQYFALKALSSPERSKE